AGSLDGTEDARASKKQSKRSSLRQAAFVICKKSRNALQHTGRAKEKGELMLGKSKQSVVGLDIGSSSIKAIELKKTKSDVKLVSFGLERRAQDTVVDGAIMDAPLVAQAIGTIFDRQGVKSKAGATSLSGHSVIVKPVSLPIMTEEE